MAVGPNRINIVGMACSCAGHLLVVGGLLWAGWSTPPRPLAMREAGALVMEMIPLHQTSGSATGVAKRMADAASAARVVRDEADRSTGRSSHLGAARPMAFLEPSAPAASSIAQAGLAAASATLTATTALSIDATFSNYQRLLNERIARHSHYPAEARRQRLAGVTHLAFRVDRQGGVLESWVQESSGSEVLDGAALEALSRAVPLPPIPAVLSSPLAFVVEIDSSITFSPPARG